VCPCVCVCVCVCVRERERERERDLVPTLTYMLAMLSCGLSKFQHDWRLCEQHNE